MNSQNTDMNTVIDIVAIAKAARLSSRRVATLDTEAKNRVLRTLAELIESDAPAILEVNRSDVEHAQRAGLAPAKLQRLTLTDKSVAQLAMGVRQVADLPDPVGEVTRDRSLPSGLSVRKVRAPLGVIAMIFESRPAVTIEAFALCFKSGNACILKGGKEAERCNAMLASLARRALEACDLGSCAGAVANISGSPREVTETMLTLSDQIDLVIPRGGHELIRFVCERSRIPTIQHYHGVCHIFVDESADVEQALNICVTAKAGAPATCNAAECILVHKNIADTFVPRLIERYRSAGVEVRGSPLVQALQPAKGDWDTFVKLAQPEDFGKEFLDLIVAMRIVPDIDAAIEHIAQYGSNHSEAILTRDLGKGGNAERFVREVQSSCVLVNASTRFNDGFQLGLGAEIGISTSRIHAYGVMGLEELTTQRWIVTGDGHTR